MAVNITQDARNLREELGTISGLRARLNADLFQIGNNFTFKGQGFAPLGSALLPAYTFLGDTDTGMWSPAANTLAWSTGGAERLRLSSSGNLLLGTTSAAGTLTVNGTAGALVNVGTFTTSGMTDNQKSYIAIGAAATSNNAFYVAYNHNALSASRYLAITPFEGVVGVKSLVLTADGNVGIGTASPLARLDFGTNLNAQQVLIYSNANTRYGLGVSGGEGRSFAPSGAVLTFGHVSTADGTSYSEKVRLDSNGNLLINTTTASYKLYVNGSFGFAPGTSVTPANNGDITPEFTSNTRVTIKGKGTDGTVRSAVLPLSTDNSLIVVDEPVADWPTVRPTLDVNFLAGEVLPGFIDFTRASVRTRTNSRGLVETLAANAPAYDYAYNATTGLWEPRGLLVEEARTNLLLQSGWDGAVAGTPGTPPTSWPFVNSGGTLGVTAAGLGNELTFSATANRQFINQACTASASTTYRYSVYVTANSGLALDQIMLVAGIPAGATATFEANRATVLGSYVPVAGDRVAVVLVVAGTAGGFTVRIGVGVSTNITGSVSLRYPQLEAGAFATSYIPTAGSTVTRTLDIASILGTNFSDFYNQSEGTFLAEWTPAAISAAYGVWAVSDGTISERMLASSHTGSHLFVADGGVTQADLDAGNPTVGANSKVATAYKANDFAVSLNGGVAVTDASGSLPTVDRLFLGNIYNGNGSGNLWLRRLTYYPTRLTNAQLQRITTL